MTYEKKFYIAYNFNFLNELYKKRNYRWYRIFSPKTSNGATIDSFPARLHGPGKHTNYARKAWSLGKLGFSQHSLTEARTIDSSP